MKKDINFDAHGRKISEGELVVRRIFADKYASPNVAPTEKQAADKFNRARLAVQLAMQQGTHPTTDFFQHVQAKQLERPSRHADSDTTESSSESS